MLHPPDRTSSSAQPPASAEEIPPAPNLPAQERWPALFKAMQDYKMLVADDFSALAGRCVNDGIIRLEDRRRLAKAARRAGINAFDAQLLIACAIRKATLEKPRPPRPQTPPPPNRRLSPWSRCALLMSTAAALDAVLIWHWFS